MSGLIALLQGNDFSIARSLDTVERCELDICCQMEGMVSSDSQPYYFHSSNLEHIQRIQTIEFYGQHAASNRYYRSSYGSPNWAPACALSSSFLPPTDRDLPSEFPNFTSSDGGQHGPEQCSTTGTIPHADNICPCTSLAIVANPIVCAVGECQASRGEQRRSGYGCAEAAGRRKGYRGRALQG